MFERYTEKARRVIFFARYEASKYGSPYITPEHLLLGLVREAPAVLASVVSQPYVTAMEEALRAQLSAKASKSLPVSVDLPLDNASKRVLAYAAEEAERKSDRHIGAEHLVLALLREPGSVAEAFRELGVELSKARERIRSELSHPGTVAESKHVVLLPGGQSLGAVELEFVDADGMHPIAVAMSVTVPQVGEEVLFKDDGESASFRVVALSYVFKKAAGSERVSRKLARIRVKLEKIAESF